MDPTNSFEQAMIEGEFQAACFETNDPIMSQMTIAASSSQQAEKEAPTLGMVFDSIDEAYKFYRDYAFFLGFGIKKRSGHNFHGERYRCKLCCNREGKPQETEKDQPSTSRKKTTIKTGCRAMMMISDPTLTGKWAVIDLNLEHNHELAPHMVRFMRCHREIPAHVKQQLKINDAAGISINKSINAMFTQGGGAENCNFVERDCRNFIANERRLSLSEGDAATLLRRFEEMQDENPDFFYSIELTKDSKLRNVFWADARSRAACDYFGDVVAFDTTYLTNRYAMPFAPFVGVNHHGKSTLLGCALLCDETTETFQWLFKRWLKCMDNKHPKGILTDQCQAMAAAISQIFPNTMHRYCIWHIMRKVPEKLGGRADKGEINEKMNQAIYDVLTIPDFESVWAGMVVEHGLENHDWIQSLYQIKHMWIPVFLNDFFWAGMSSTQRSESMNSFFDGYVTSKTTLTLFFEQYTNALRSRYEKEAEADFKSLNQEPQLLTCLEFEK